MLFKNKHHLNEMRRNGRRATAEIISIKTVGEGKTIRSRWAMDEDLGSSWVDCLMRLRVTPEQGGEPAFEATATARVHALEYLGGTVPVWYRPGDTSRVVVDHEADLAGEMHWMADAERLAHRHDQRAGLVWSPMGNDLVPFEVLAKPGRGRVAVKGHLDRFLAEHAAAAVESVRGHVASVAPEADPGWLERNDVQIDVPYGVIPASLTAVEAASAGLAIAVALASLVSGRLVRTEVAVTGEIGPDGALLPVRGFREKAHCAKRGYAKLLLAPATNAPDIHQVSQQDRRDLHLVFTASPAEAFSVALAQQPARDHSPAS
jgi:ATP-dependent Lon protease